MGKTLMLTGATGFVGSRFAVLNAGKYEFKTIPWQQLSDPVPDLAGVDIIVHLAALNHRMDKVPDEDYMKSNFELTKLLAEKAKSDGVGHFVFLSTVKVYGEANIEGKPFTEIDTCNPQDAYGQSKLNAENALTSLKSESFKVSIIRSPLVYGPGVKGNMLRLIKLAKSPFPLGFKGIENNRTMVFVDNLVALIDRIIEQGQPGVFLAADDQPVSTSDAVIMLREALNKRANIFQMPGILLSLMGLVAPKLKTRLFDSLIFDNDDTKKRLNFRNPYTTQEGFRLMLADRPNQSG